MTAAIRRVAGAVIFDCDGTIVDSEPLCERAWSAVLAGWGFVPSDEDFLQVRGQSYHDTWSHFAARVSGLPDAQMVYRRYWPELAQLYRADLRAFPDALSLLDLLRPLLPVAVASSSYRHRLDLTLALVGLGDVPSVAGDEVARAKPAPDLFLSAAEMLAVDPRRCLVVEDSQAGIDAARAAGMRVVAVNRTGAPLTGAEVDLRDCFGLTMAADERS